MIIVRSEPIKYMLEGTIPKRNRKMLSPCLLSVSRELACCDDGPVIARRMIPCLVGAQDEFRERFGRFGRKEFMSAILPAAFELYCREPELFSSAIHAILEHGEDVKTRKVGAYFRSAAYHMAEAGYRVDILDTALRDIRNELEHSTGSEVLRQTKALFSKAAEGRKAAKENVVSIARVKDALKDVLPEKVQEAGTASLAGFTADAQDVLSGKVDPSTLTPLVYSGVMREIAENFATSDLSGSASAKMEVESSHEEAMRFNSEFGSLKELMRECKARLASGPSRDYIANRLDNMEAGINRMVHDYIFSLSIAYSRIYREALFRNISEMSRHCRELLKAQETGDLRTLLSMDLSEKFGFLSSGKISMEKEDDKPIRSFGPSFLPGPAEAVIDGSKVSIRLRDSRRLIALIDDITPGLTMVDPLFLIGGVGMKGGFKTYTNEKGIVLSDPEAGDPIEAFITMEGGVPPGKDALILVDGDGVEIECDSRSVTMSLGELRSKMTVRDNREGLSDEDYVELDMRAVSNISVIAMGSALRRMPIAEQKDILGKAVHIIRKTYGADNVSMVLSHTSEIHLKDDRYANGRTTSSGEVTLSFNRRDPEDIAFTLVHEDGHNYAEAILESSFSGYLLPGMDRMIGFTTVSDMLKSTVHEIFANMAALRFGISAVGTGTMSSDAAIARSSEFVERIESDLEGLSRMQNLSERGKGLADVLTGEFVGIRQAYTNMKEGAGQRPDLFSDYSPPGHAVWKHGSAEAGHLFFEDFLAFSVEPSLKQYDKKFPDKKMLPKCEMRLLPSPQNEPLTDLIVRKNVVEEEIKARLVLDRYGEDEILDMAYRLGYGDKIKPELEPALRTIIETNEDAKKAYDEGRKERAEMDAAAGGVNGARKPRITAAPASQEDEGFDEYDDSPSDGDYDDYDGPVQMDPEDEYVIGLNEPEDEGKRKRRKKEGFLLECYEDMKKNS